MSLEGLHRALDVARDYDYHDPKFRGIGEPPILDLFLENLPTIYSPRTKQWTMFGYDEAKAVLEQPESWANNVSLVPQELRIPGVAVLGQEFPVYPEHADGQLHRDYRRGLNPLFSPKAVGPLEPQLRELATRLLEPLVAKGEFDLVLDFAAPFPTLAFCSLLGLPIDDADKIKQIVDTFLHFSSPLFADRIGLTADERDEAGVALPEVQERLLNDVGEELFAYFAEQFELRRAEPRDDILTKLLSITKSDGSPLDEDELARMAFNLTVGGTDTTTAVIGATVWDFFKRPAFKDEFIELMDDPAALTTAVNELVRYHSIVYVPRRATSDFEFAGIQFHEHDLVNLDLTAASRDPRQFPNPHELDFSRAPNAHLAFGHGAHRCLGMHVAGLELRVALQEIFSRMPRYEVIGDPVIITSGQRGMESLRVRIAD